MAKKKKQKKLQHRTESSPVRTEGSAPVQAKVTGLEAGEAFIRRDILRIVGLLSIVAVVIIVLAVVNVKSNALGRAGHTLAQFFQLI